MLKKIFFIGLITFLHNYSSLGQQKGWKLSCNQSLKYYNLKYTDSEGRIHYVTKLIKAREDFKAARDTTKKAAFLLSIAACLYCLDYPIDSVNYYLRASYRMDGGSVICRVVHTLEELNNRPNAVFRKLYVLQEGKNLFDFPYVDKCLETPILDTSTYRIKELKKFAERDQLYRNEINNIHDSIALKQWSLDSLIRKDFISFYAINKKLFEEELSSKDKSSIFFILIHAPYQFIEEHIEVVNELAKHKNISLFQFVVARFFCNKYGKTPIDGYCEKDESLVPELKRLFPTYQINE